MGALPTFVLYFEFGDYQLKNCGNVAWYFARFYSHFFVYPVTFGFFSTYFLTFPLIQGVGYLCDLPEPTRTKKIAAIVFFLLLTVGAAAYAEFQRATVGLWEPPPNKTLSEPSESDNTFRTFLENRCCETKSEEKTEEETKKEETNREDFTDLLKELTEQQNSGSWTERVYYFGHLSSFSLFMILLVTIFIAVTAGKMGHHMMPPLTYALIFASFWVLMRIAYMTEKYSIYDIKDDPLFVFNGIIFLVFLVGYIYLFTFSTDSINDVDKTNRVFLTIFGILELFLGTIGITDWMPDTLVRLFGTKSDLLTYIIIFLFLLVVFFPSILRCLEGRPKPEPS